ncbi:mechanosensitive ion channel family protein [Tengunoibacter tsumagoiensis]|nr:mechanosensitive ion channel domain-containing protein [Tengunoibacter tsumagoiensis]
MSLSVPRSFGFDTTGGVEIISMIGNIVLSVGVIIAALIIGLYLRRRLVQLLKKTVLDESISQILGGLIVLLPLALGSVIALAVWRNDLLGIVADFLHLNPKDVPGLLGNIVATFLLAGLGVGLARTVKNLTIRGLSENRIDINIRTFIGRLFYTITLVIAGFWILSIWSISSSNLVAAASVITVAITFAIQDILKDLVAGFYILLERPFFIGDQISITIAPTVIYVGKVESVELRATKLRLVGGEEITIPNAILFGNAVINNTYYGERRATIIVKVHKDDYSQEHTIPSIIEELKKVDNVLEKPEPIALLNSYVDNTFVLVVRFWIPSGQTHDISEMVYALHTLLPNADLEAKEPGGMI